MVASVALYRFAALHDEVRRENELRRQTENRHALIHESLRGYEEALFALKLLFTDSDAVTRAEFQRAAGALIARHPGVFAFQWLPRVAGGERADWETAGQREGRPGFQIEEHEAGGRLVRARERAEYFPVLYSEPDHTDWNPVGCDLGVGRLREVLERARATRAAAMSGRITLLYQTEQRKGVLLASPLFGVPGSAGAGTLRGYLLSIFQVDDLLAASWRSAPESVVDVMFVDDSAVRPGERLLFYRSARPGVGAVPTEAEFRRGLYRELPLTLGGRHWRALYRPNAAAIGPASRAPAIVLGSSLIITALLAAYLVRSARHTRLVEREVAERTAELSESRRQLDALMQALPGMAYRARLDDARLVLLYASEGALALCGYTPEELVGRTVQFRDLIHPDDRAAAGRLIHAALVEARQPFEVEYRLRARDGAEKWILSRGRGVYDDRGCLLFFEGLAIDISAQKQAEAGRIAIERKLLDSQKLESLGLLAGGIAHDFNNLLAGMMGHANLARLKLDAAAPAAEHLHQIESAAARAAELCQQMLAYSGRGRFVVEPVDLNRLVQDTLPLLHGALSTHARLELSLASTPPFVMADATQIRQIVMNLILNAGDALGAAAGRIDVATGVRPVDAAALAVARGGEALAPGAYAFLEVRDTGCGMTPETLARIFDPFFTTKFTGRGLGLAAVLGIVRGHAGALGVASTPGAGSTFTLLLPPLPGGPPPSAPAASTATPWQRASRILVIDDEAGVRDVAGQLLRTFGMSVVSAIDGQDGVARFRENPAGFDLVLLDLTMPGMNGEETLAALRALAPGVRVLLMSGYSESDRVARLAGGGPIGFLQKPFTRALLERKLRAMLG